MTSRIPLLMLAAGLAVGGGLGFAAGRRSAPETAHAPAPAEPPAPAPVTDTSLPVTPETGVTRLMPEAEALRRLAAAGFEPWPQEAWATTAQGYTREPDPMSSVVRFRRQLGRISHIVTVRFLHGAVQSAGFAVQNHQTGSTTFSP